MTTKWIGEDGRPHDHTSFCRANGCTPVPATPAPSQPAGAREFIQHFYGWDDSDMTRSDIPAFSLNQAAELAHAYARQQTAAKDAEHDTHIAEFQQAVYETCKAIARECGQSDHAIDGAGSDGDEIEFTVTEVKQAFDLLRDAKEAAERERDSWRESAKYWCRLAEAGEREIERLRRERTEEQLKAGKGGQK